MLNFREIKTRLTWLSLGLLLSVAIAKFIGQFEETLKQNIVLAAFIPLVVYMSDAVGTQMEAMIIRQLQNKKRFYIGRFLTKQLFVVVPVAVIIAVLAFAVLMAIYQDPTLALVVSLSLAAGIFTSLLTGAILPYWFWREHKDPAEASGPIATVLQDFISVVVFLMFATLFY